MRAEAFTRTAIADENTREIVSRLIKEAAAAIQCSSEYWRSIELNELIKAARNLDLNELADELVLWTT